MIFVHGIGGDLDAWHFMRDALLKKGYSYLAMDLRGHGYSGHPQDFAAYEMDRFVEDLLMLIRAEKLEKVVLLGHCFGGVIAMNFALKYPDKLNKLILISTSYKEPNYIVGRFMKKIVIGFLDFIAFLSPKPYRPGHSSYPDGKFHKDFEFIGLVKTIFHNSLRSYLLCVKQVVKLDLKSRLKEIEIPTLVIVGEKDSIFPMSISNELHKNIKGSDFEVIEGANHVIVLNNVETLVNIIDNYLC